LGGHRYLAVVVPVGSEVPGSPGVTTEGWLR
jgi:hypothetical protein